MDQIYEQVLKYMEATVHGLAKHVPAPQRIRTNNWFVFRHVEKSLHQAIVQKLARLVSTLYATRLLLNHGFVQEVGALKRILDEIQDDILFLLSGIDNQSTLHREFLDAFFEEEFDADTALESTQKRTMISRRKIRAHNARVIADIPDSPFDTSRTTEILRTINKANSGYVHAASPQIMELYGGNPPHFHMSGMLGTPPSQTPWEDFWNYVCRSIYAFGLVAKAFGNDVAWGKISDYARWFEETRPNNG